MEATAQKTWKPTVAGILAIVGAGLSLLCLMGILIAFLVIPTSATLVITILTYTAIYSGIAGVLLLIGGIFALRRKMWGLALAGSIAAILGLTPIGVLSTIFIVLSKDEFE